MGPTQGVLRNSPLGDKCNGYPKGKWVESLIREGKREALKPKGLLVEFFKELSFGGNTYVIMWVS